MSASRSITPTTSDPSQPLSSSTVAARRQHFAAPSELTLPIPVQQNVAPPSPDGTRSASVASSLSSRSPALSNSTPTRKSPSLPTARWAKVSHKESELLLTTPRLKSKTQLRAERKKLLKKAVMMSAVMGVMRAHSKNKSSLEGFAPAHWSSTDTESESEEQKEHQRKASLASVAPSEISTRSSQASPMESVDSNATSQFPLIGNPQIVVLHPESIPIPSSMRAAGEFEQESAARRRALQKARSGFENLFAAPKSASKWLADQVNDEETRRVQTKFINVEEERAKQAIEDAKAEVIRLKAEAEAAELEKKKKPPSSTFYMRKPKAQDPSSSSTASLARSSSTTSIASSVAASAAPSPPPSIRARYQPRPTAQQIQQHRQAMAAAAVAADDVLGATIAPPATLPAPTLFTSSSAQSLLEANPSKLYSLEQLESICADPALLQLISTSSNQAEEEKQVQVTGSATSSRLTSMTNLHVNLSRQLSTNSLNLNSSASISKSASTLFTIDSPARMEVSGLNPYADSLIPRSSALPSSDNESFQSGLLDPLYQLSNDLGTTASAAGGRTEEKEIIASQAQGSEAQSALSQPRSRSTSPKKSSSSQFFSQNRVQSVLSPSVSNASLLAPNTQTNTSSLRTLGHSASTQSYQAHALSLRWNGKPWSEGVFTASEFQHYLSLGLIHYMKRCAHSKTMPIAAVMNSVLSQGLSTGATLSIHHYGLNEIEASCISTLMQYNCTITQLDLTDNNLGSSGVDAIAKGIMYGRPSEGGSDPSYASSADLNAASVTGGNRTILTLKFDHNNFERGASTVLTARSSTKNNSAASGNSPGSDSTNPSLPPLSPLGKMLSYNTTLTSLHLSHCHLSDRHISDFVPALSDEVHRSRSGLKILVLDNNLISDRGAKTISDMLDSNSTLTHLDLSHNCIRDPGGVYLADAISKHSSLLRFNIGYNGLGSKAGLAFASAIAAKSFTLQQLNLEHNQIAGSQTWKKLMASLISNQKIKLVQEIEEVENKRKQQLAMAAKATGIHGPQALPVSTTMLAPSNSLFAILPPQPGRSAQMLAQANNDDQDATTTSTASSKLNFAALAASPWSSNGHSRAASDDGLPMMGNLSVNVPMVSQDISMADLNASLSPRSSSLLEEYGGLQLINLSGNKLASYEAGIIADAQRELKEFYYEMIQSLVTRKSMGGEGVPSHTAPGHHPHHPSEGKKAQQHHRRNSSTSSINSLSSRTSVKQKESLKKTVAYKIVQATRPLSPKSDLYHKLASGSGSIVEGWETHETDNRKRNQLHFQVANPDITATSIANSSGEIISPSLKRAPSKGSVSVSGSQTERSSTRDNRDRKKHVSFGSLSGIQTSREPVSSNSQSKQLSPSVIQQQSEILSPKPRRRRGPVSSIEFAQMTDEEKSDYLDHLGEEDTGDPEDVNISSQTSPAPKLKLDSESNEIESNNVVSEIRFPAIPSATPASGNGSKRSSTHSLLLGSHSVEGIPIFDPLSLINSPTASMRQLSSKRNSLRTSFTFSKSGSMIAHPDRPGARAVSPTSSTVSSSFSPRSPLAPMVEDSALLTFDPLANKYIPFLAMHRSPSNKHGFDSFEGGLLNIQFDTLPDLLAKAANDTHTAAIRKATAKAEAIARAEEARVAKLEAQKAQRQAQEKRKMRKMVQGDHPLVKLDDADEKEEKREAASKKKRKEKAKAKAAANPNKGKPQVQSYDPATGEIILAEPPRKKKRNKVPHSNAGSEYDDDDDSESSDVEEEEEEANAVQLTELTKKLPKKTGKTPQAQSRSLAGNSSKLKIDLTGTSLATPSSSVSPVSMDSLSSYAATPISERSDDESAPTPAVPIAKGKISRKPSPSPSPPPPLSTASKVNSALSFASTVSPLGVMKSPRTWKPLADAPLALENTKVHLSYAPVQPYSNTPRSAPSESADAVATEGGQPDGLTQAQPTAPVATEVIEPSPNSKQEEDALISAVIDPSTEAAASQLDESKEATPLSPVAEEQDKEKKLERRKLRRESSGYTEAINSDLAHASKMSYARLQRRKTAQQQQAQHTQSQLQSQHQNQEQQSQQSREATEGRRTRDDRREDRRRQRRVHVVEKQQTVPHSSVQPHVPTVTIRAEPEPKVHPAVIAQLQFQQLQQQELLQQQEQQRLEAEKAENLKRIVSSLAAQLAAQRPQAVSAAPVPERMHPPSSHGSSSQPNLQSPRLRHLKKRNGKESAVPPSGSQTDRSANRSASSAKRSHHVPHMSGEVIDRDVEEGVEYEYNAETGHRVKKQVAYRFAPRTNRQQQHDNLTVSNPQLNEGPESDDAHVSFAPLVPPRPQVVVPMPLLDGKSTYSSSIEEPPTLAALLNPSNIAVEPPAVDDPVFPARRIKPRAIELGSMQPDRAILTTDGSRNVENNLIQQAVIAANRQLPKEHRIDPRSVASISVGSLHVTPQSTRKHVKPTAMFHNLPSSLSEAVLSPHAPAAASTSSSLSVVTDSDEVAAAKRMFKRSSTKSFHELDSPKGTTTVKSKNGKRATLERRQE